MKIKQSTWHSLFECPLGILFAGLLGVSASAHTLQLNECAKALQKEDTDTRTFSDTRIFSHNQTQAVVIVDATSSGGLIAPVARKRGLIPIHLQSSAFMDPSLLRALHLEDFDADKQFVFRGDWDKLQSQLTEFPITAVIAGCETGVNVSDELSERMGVTTNGTTLTRARRDKFEMIETLRRGGVPVAKQFLARNLKQILAGLPLIGYPAIIKPRDAAAGFGVAKESSFYGVLAAVKTLLQETNPLTNLPISDALVQEYLDGDEYVVDIAMMGGELYVTDVTRYNKIPFNGSPVVYESEDMVSVAEAARLGLIDYAQSVVDALGIRYGAGHMEIKLTSKGPRLVEVAARLSGGGFPVMVKEATGEDPIDAVLDGYFDPEAFRARMKRPHRLKPAAVVYLMSPRGGRLTALPYLEEISRLDSFFRYKPNVPIGDRLEPTTNFLNYPGQIELINEDPEQLARDRARVRELESRPDFYQLEL